MVPVYTSRVGVVPSCRANSVRGLGEGEEIPGCSKGRALTIHRTGTRTSVMGRSPVPPGYA
jgi:hypothetical protein